METHKDSERTGNSQAFLQGLGKKLKLHIIIPVLYAAILIIAFIVTHV